MSKKKLVNVIPPVNKSQKLTSPKLPRGHHKLSQPYIREDKPSISLKHLDLNFKSFNDLRDGHKLKEWDSFLSKLNSSPDWDYVFRTFRCAPTGTSKAMDMMKKLGMDEQLEMVHLRVNDEFRIHGFVMDGRFKLVWLDPHHEINKM